MLVKDLLRYYPKTIITTSKEANILVAMEALLQNRISSLPVVEDDNRLIGIVSDKDIFRTAYEKRENFLVLTVEHIMTTNLIVGVEDDDLDYIAALMTNNRIRHIPIVNGEHIVGLVSIGDVVKTQIKNVEVENRFLKQYIEGSYPA
jgi:CBS domain-containing protein